jgi:peptidyl-prolyl cis-trans isomerase D
MMQQMRENTKWIMLITALAFVALMVFEWGMDMSGRSAGALTGGQLGTVNGSAITYDEFSRTYRNLYEQRQRQGSTISASENRAIEDQAWEQLVMDRLVDQELERRGIRVTDEEIRQAARVAPPPEFYSYELFQTNGQFDLEKYHRFLASASDPQLLRDLEAYYRRVIPRNKLFQQIGATIVVTDGELWLRYRERNETASMRYVVLDPRSLVSDAEVTAEERAVAAYYNEHRDDFERPAQAEVRIVAVDKAPTAADTAASLEQARDVRREIVEEGADFAEVAARESEDEASAQQGGSLGTVTRGQTVPAFEEALWAAPVGEVTEPVLTEYGYHLIRVDSRTDEEAEASHILVPIRRTLESEDSMLATVDSLESMVERMSLAAAAEDLGLDLRTTELTPLIPNVPGVGAVDEGVDWVFEEAPVGDAVSPVFENERRFYVMELVSRDEARALTLEEARSTIESILRLERKRERTRDTGRQLVDRIEAGASLEEAAQALELPVRDAGPFTRVDFVPGVGSGNAAIGAAFGLEVGETSGLVETPDAFYVIQVTDRTEADREAWQEQVDQQRQQLVGSLQTQRLNQFLEALREEARVVDERDRVLQQSGSAT